MSGISGSFNINTRPKSVIDRLSVTDVSTNLQGVKTTSVSPLMLIEPSNTPVHDSAHNIIEHQMNANDVVKKALIRAEINNIISSIPSVENRLGLKSSGDVSIDIKNLNVILEQSARLAAVLEKTGQMVFVVDDQDCFRLGGSLGTPSQANNYNDKVSFFEKIYDPNINALMNNSLLTAATGDAHEPNNPTKAPIKALQITPIVKGVPTSGGQFTEWVWPPHDVANDDSVQGSNIVASEKMD